MKPVRLWKSSDDADVDILRRCKSAITGVVGDADVILYGSRARGHASEDSDYDIVVVVNGAVDMALEDRIRASMHQLKWADAMWNLPQKPLDGRRRNY